MKTEIWNGHPIRFVEKDGEWWAAAKDAADALDFRDANAATRKLPAKYKTTHKVRSIRRGNPNLTLINEPGLYRMIMRSNKPDVEDFQDWVFEMLKQLRQSTGLEGFQIFRMLDKEHQKAAMSHLKNGLPEPKRKDFIKANTIANKAVSLKHGYPKMLKKGEMTPGMLVDRQELLDDAVELIKVKEKFHLQFSVSDQIYAFAVGNGQSNAS